MTTHHLDTRVVHTPHVPVTGSTPKSVPIHQTAGFTFDTPEALADAFTGPDGAFLYTRYANPTVRALENAVAALEGGTHAIATASGMGAINGVLHTLLKTGDHVIAQNNLYGGTYATLQDLSTRYGIDVTYVTNPQEIAAATRPTTKILYLETVSNPTARVSDIPAYAAAAPNLTVIVDNTFTSPILCRPLEHGADIVIHSATKFLGGHGDVTGGLAVFKDPTLHNHIWHHTIELGVTADPFQAWLTIRGLQTLTLRLRQQCTTAQTIAERLHNHPAVSAVHWPGLPTHPDHALAQQLLPDGYGATFSFDLTGGRTAGENFMRNVKLIHRAPSLGGVQSVTMHPASTSHRQLDEPALTAAGIGPGTVRLGLGIEHPEDLWNDIEQALK